MVGSRLLQMGLEHAARGRSYLERTDLKDFKEKSKVVIGILSKYGRQGASFAKLYRLGWEKKKISRGDMKAILGILMGRGVIRCEDDMYYLI